MNSALIAILVFVCVFGGVLAGIAVRVASHHQDADTRDVVKLVMGLIATIAALVLSLLYEQGEGALSWPFLVVLVFWLVALFAGIRTLCARQRHRNCGAVLRRVDRRGRDLPEPGDEPALQRIHADLQRADQERAGADRALTRGSSRLDWSDSLCNRVSLRSSARDNNPCGSTTRRRCSASSCFL
jgi:hypothetical protein